MQHGSTDVSPSVAPPIGASTWERDLFDHLIGHVTQERVLLEEYERAAGSTESKALAYLVNLLLGDERRHHAIFEQLACSLKSSAELRGDSPDVPRLDFDADNRAEVLEVTAQLLKRERQDLKELKRLHRELSDVKDTTLWDLLVELMERDTDKHIAILEFVRRHARRGP